MKNMARIVTLVCIILGAANLAFPPVESHSNLFTKRSEWGLAKLPSSDSGNFRRVPIWQTFYTTVVDVEINGTQEQVFHSFRVEWLTMLAFGAGLAWIACAAKGMSNAPL
jgi:hypothetical protein